MKKKISIFCILTMLIISMTGCTSGSDNDSNKDEKVYIDESEVPELFTNPDSFKGKYVELSGQIFTAPEKSDGTTALQIYYDPVNYSNNFIVHYDNTDTTFNQNDYVIVEGMISGTFKGENMLGGTIAVPLITADSVEVSTYVDVVSPTIKSIDVNRSKEQYGYSLSVDKVEFAGSETRVYVTIANNGASTFSLFPYDMKISQNSNQFSYKENYDANYEQVQTGGGLMPGNSTSGVVTFENIDMETDFTLQATGYSDNYEETFEAFEIQISPSGNYEEIDANEEAAANAEAEAALQFITLEEYEQLTVGMIYDEVVAIVGGEGEVVSESGEPGTEYYYQIFNFYGDSNKSSSASITFSNGALDSKSQYGLK